MEPYRSNSARGLLVCFSFDFPPAPTRFQRLVTLKGELEWPYQKQDAERVVRWLAGVKGGSYLITIKPRANPPELKKKIEDALVCNAEIDANESPSMCRAAKRF